MHRCSALTRTVRLPPRQTAQPVVQLVLDDCQGKQQEPPQVAPPKAPRFLADAPQPLAVQSADQDRSAPRDATCNPGRLTNTQRPARRQAGAPGVYPNLRLWCADAHDQNRRIMIIDLPNQPPALILVPLEHDGWDRCLHYDGSLPGPAMDPPRRRLTVNHEKQPMSVERAAQ